MSYILDALKKADRERSLAKVPSLTTVQVPVHVPGGRAAVWIAAIALTGGGLAAWFLWPSPVRLPVAPRGPGASVEAPAPVESLTLERTPSPPVSPVVPGPRATTSLPVVPPAPLPSEATRLPQPEVPVTSRQIRPHTRQPSKASPLPPEPTAPVPIPQTPVPAPAPQRPETSAQSERAPAPPAPVPMVAPPATPTQTTLREASAKLTLDVFVYTDVEADRMVIIGGRRYVKGQLVDGLYLLEDITPEGAVLSYQGERIVLRP